MFELSTSPSTPSTSTPTPPRRKRDRRLSLTKVDRRGRLGKRISELTATFTSALGGGELSPVRRIKVQRAAELLALAEAARGDWMRAGTVSLEDVVRCEREADRAVHALGTLEQKPRAKTLAEVLSSPRGAQ
jgi:hypothetical protein